MHNKLCVCVFVGKCEHTHSCEDAHLFVALSHVSQRCSLMKAASFWSAGGRRRRRGKDPVSHVVRCLLGSSHLGGVSLFSSSLRCSTIGGKKDLHFQGLGLTRLRLGSPSSRCRCADGCRKNLPYSVWMYIAVYTVRLRCTLGSKTRTFRPTRKVEDNKEKMKKKKK